MRDFPTIMGLQTWVVGGRAWSGRVLKKRMKKEHRERGHAVPLGPNSARSLLSADPARAHMLEKHLEYPLATQDTRVFSCGPRPIWPHHSTRASSKLARVPSSSLRPSLLEPPRRQPLTFSSSPSVSLSNGTEKSPLSVVSRLFLGRLGWSRGVASFSFSRLFFASNARVCAGASVRIRLMNARLLVQADWMTRSERCFDDC